MIPSMLSFHYQIINMTVPAVSPPMVRLNNRNTRLFLSNLPSTVPNPAQIDMDGIQITAKTDVTKMVDER